MCTMNLSDAGIEAFRLTMNCAIGTSLQEQRTTRWWSIRNNFKEGQEGTKR
jgi:hypothetical protein